jgi:hypothetical protein
LEEVAMMSEYSSTVVMSPNGDCVLVAGQETELHDVANTLSVVSGLPEIPPGQADILLDTLRTQWGSGYVEIVVTHRGGRWQI